MQVTIARARITDLALPLYWRRTNPNSRRIILVGDSVIKDQVTIGRRDKLPFGLRRHEAWREFVITQETVQVVVTELERVVSKVRQRVIDLTAHQILRII